MNKEAPSLGRILTMVVFALSCFGLLLFLWLAFGGSTPLKPKGYRFTTSFGEATQLAKEADVRISGVSVGKVKTIEADKRTGRSTTVIELDPRYAPLPKDARAVLRQKTLLGETYVELSPGHRQAGFVPEGGTLPASRVSQTVELDEIFRAFSPRTREQFQTWMQEQAVATKGRGRDLSDAIGNLSPFAEDTNQLLEILDSQSSDVRRLVANTGEVFKALSERQGQLSSLITSSNTVFGTTARRNGRLQETFKALPTFEDEARKTVTRLTSFAKQTDPLVTQLRPAARELSPTLTQLGALAPDLQALFRGLDPLITASRQGLPATTRFLDELRPFLGQLDPTLQQLNPVLDYVGAYRQELTTFFANTVGATQATQETAGKPVHYLRTTNPLNIENLATYPQRLGSNRSNPYEFPGAFKNLAKGLPVYEDRNCGRANIPTLASNAVLTGALGTALTNQLILTLGRAGGAPADAAPAPPCRQQPPYTVNGQTSQFPHVTASRAGATPTVAGAAPAPAGPAAATAGR